MVSMESLVEYLRSEQRRQQGCEEIRVYWHEVVRDLARMDAVGRVSKHDCADITRHLSTLARAGEVQDEPGGQLYRLPLNRQINLPTGVRK